MVSQLLSRFLQEAKGCLECQGLKVNQASQDLQDSQDCLGPQDCMDSQELLAERGPWGCQAPLALEVRLLSFKKKSLIPSLPQSGSNLQLPSLAL